MKKISKKLLIFSIIALLLSTKTVISYGETSDDPIKPLPQVNKTFQILVHIVLNEEGEAEVTPEEIQAVIPEINGLFAPIAISFNVCEVRYIENYNYNNPFKIPQSELKILYNSDNRINMYFVGTAQGHKCGYAALGGIISNQLPNVVIDMSCINARTIGHELGHYFGLKHTFQGNGIENANRSNCETAGDGICDTPADPYNDIRFMSDFINQSCEFIYTEKDANGDFYDPDLGNIMSYYPCSCYKFTHGQYESMANHYLSNPFAW